MHSQHSSQTFSFIPQPKILLNFSYHPYIAFLLLSSLLFTKTESVTLPAQSSKGFLAIDKCYPEEEQNELIFNEACSHSQKPANKVDDKKYSLVKIEGRTLIGQFFTDSTKIKLKRQKVSEFLIAQNKFVMLHQPFFPDYPSLTFEQIQRFNLLANILVNTKAMVEINYTVCGSSTFFSMGKFIAMHLLQDKEMPTLIAVELGSDYSAQSDWNLFHSRKLHVLPDHTTLLVVRRKDFLTQSIIDEIKKIVKNSSTKQGLVFKKNDTRLYEKLKKLPLSLCDAWAEDTSPLEGNRPPNDVISLLKRPELIKNIRIISEEDLVDLADKSTQELLQYVFLTPEHKQFWEKQLKEIDISTKPKK